MNPPPSLNVRVCTHRRTRGKKSGSNRQMAKHVPRKVTTASKEIDKASHSDASQRTPQRAREWGARAVEVKIRAHTSNVLVFTKLEVAVNGIRTIRRPPG